MGEAEREMLLVSANGGTATITPRCTSTAIVDCSKLLFGTQENSLRTEKEVSPCHVGHILPLFCDFLIQDLLFFNTRKVFQEPS